MAVTLRLQRRGQKKRPFYRIVAAEQSYRRDGRFLEIVGTYNPMTDPSTIPLPSETLRFFQVFEAQEMGGLRRRN